MYQWPPKRSNVLKKIKRKVFNKYILPAVYFHRAPSPYWHRPSSWAPSRRFAGRGIGSPCVTRPPHSTHRLSSLSEIPIFISFAGSRLFQKGKLTTKGVANLLFGQVSLKTVWTWRKLDRGGRVTGSVQRPKFYYFERLLDRVLVMENDSCCAKWPFSKRIQNIYLPLLFCANNDSFY